MDMIVGMLESMRGTIPFALTLTFIISFSLVVIYIITRFGYIRKQFDVNRSFWIFLILIILLGLGLRIITPIFFPAYFDDLSNVEVSKNIIYYGQPLICEYQIPEQPSCYTSAVPNSFNYIFSIFLILLGISMHSAFIAIMIIGLLAVILITISVYLLFKNEKIALWSGFFLSIFPLYILQSRTLSEDTTFILLIFLTLFAFTLLSKRMDIRTGIFAVASLVLAFTTKQEGLLLLPLFIVFILLFVDFNFLKKIHRSRKFWYLVILFIMLIIPHILHLSIELYPTLLYGEKTGLAPFGLLGFENIADGTWIFNRFAGTYYPWIFNLLIIISILYCIKKSKKELTFLSLFFILYLLVYLTFSGGMHEKYLVVMYAPLIVLGGIGVFYLEDILSGIILKRIKGKNLSRRISFIVSCILLVIIFSSFLPFLDKLDDVMPLDSRSGYTRDHVFYEESSYIESIREELNNAYVVSEFPMVFAGTHAKPIGTLGFLSYNYTNPEETFGRIYYFEDVFCTDFYSYGNRCGIENESFETCEAFRRDILSRCEEMYETYELIPFLEYTFNVSENTRVQHGTNTSVVSFHIYTINGRKSS